MRKSREETARTRERILDAASEEIRANGVAGSGLAGVMKAAGLTHGGFYKHFGSKDQLVTESVARAFEQVLGDRKSTRLNSSHQIISYAVFCLKKKITHPPIPVTGIGTAT